MEGLLSLYWYRNKEDNAISTKGKSKKGPQRSGYSIGGASRGGLKPTQKKWVINRRSIIRAQVFIHDRPPKTNGLQIEGYKWCVKSGKECSGNSGRKGFKWFVKSGKESTGNSLFGRKGFKWFVKSGKESIGNSLFGRKGQAHVVFAVPYGVLNFMTHALLTERPVIEYTSSSSLVCFAGQGLGIFTPLKVLMKNTEVVRHGAMNKKHGSVSTRRAFFMTRFYTTQRIDNDDIYDEDDERLLDDFDNYGHEEKLKSASSFLAKGYLDYDLSAGSIFMSKFEYMKWWSDAAGDTEKENSIMEFLKEHHVYVCGVSEKYLLKEEARTERRFTIKSGVVWGTTDAGYKARKGSIGSVLRDSSGAVKIYLSKPITKKRVGSAEDAELYSTEETISTALQQKYTHLVLFGDCGNVVNCMNNKGKAKKSMFRRRYEKLLQDVGGFTSFRMYFINREGNNLAHFCAQRAMLGLPCPKFMVDELALQEVKKNFYHVLRQKDYVKQQIEEKKRLKRVLGKTKWRKK